MTEQQSDFFHIDNNLAINKNVVDYIKIIEYRRTDEILRRKVIIYIKNYTNN